MIDTTDPLIAATHAMDAEDGKHIKIPQPDWTILVNAIIALRARLASAERWSTKIREQTWSDADNIHQKVHNERLAKIDELTTKLAAVTAERDGMETALREIRIGKIQADNEHPLGELASMGIRFHTIARLALANQKSE